MWWSIDRDVAIHQSLADFVDVVDGVGEMAKVSVLSDLIGMSRKLGDI